MDPAALLAWAEEDERQRSRFVSLSREYLALERDLGDPWPGFDHNAATKRQLEICREMDAMPYEVDDDGNVVSKEPTP